MGGTFVIMPVLKCAAAVAILATVSTANAQTPAEFYKGKTVELYIGYSVGGGYDLYARVLARHLGKALATSLRPAILDRDSAALDPAELAQSLRKSGDIMAPGRSRSRP